MATTWKNNLKRVIGSQPNILFDDTVALFDDNAALFGDIAPPTTWTFINKTT